jgi:hypothetical protein
MRELPIVDAVPSEDGRKITLLFPRAQSIVVYVAPEDVEFLRLSLARYKERLTNG